MTTINEIAKLSKVSAAAAYEVLHENAESTVSEETKSRIFQAAETLNYRLTEMQMSSASNNCIHIALAILDAAGGELENPFFIALRKHVEQACLLNNVHIKETIRYENINSTNKMEPLDGIIVIGRLQKNDLEKLKKVSKNIVFVTDWTADSTEDIVSIDLAQMTELVISHLKDMGHERIGYIGASNWGQTMKEQLEKANLLSEEHIYLTEPYGTEGYRILKEAASNRKLADAYIIQSSVMSLAAIMALREENVKIPEDVSIVSFYDVPEAHYFAPSLTAIHVSSAEIAKIALKLLQEQVIEHRDTPLKVLVPSTLKMRESTSTKQ
ncbi:LacI family DNA-binding transcriptional regulator [Metabacillus dongyingensis]|uniref:LacI family DNA-binding transcriptional regulator n=1 Tax=Metabacillus dongyingensis TaxID=2874282 RepID=UPI001CC0D91F|nr:LacI family DNA-binding transcriptional regulator [Metabacillus dongyingensis]UAL51669.1 substrate-binding domain-containing protein [Metabacillus dongyingensis]